jgi:hypothetical protein
MATKQPIILTDGIVPPPALIRAGTDALPSIILARGERASRRFIEFFTAKIPNRNTRMAYARAVKRSSTGATSASSNWWRSNRSASPPVAGVGALLSGTPC